MELDPASIEELSGLPRDQIPAEWAHRGACPVCAAEKSLGVKHDADVPDRFVCEHCAVEFELHSSSSQIRVMVLPELLKLAWNEVISQWMQPADARRLYQRYQSVHQISSLDDDDDVSQPLLTNREVYYQALELQKLGNEDEKVAALLLQAGATREQAIGALRKLKQQAEEKSKRRSCIFITMAAVAVFMLVLVSGGLWITSKKQQTQETESIESTDDNEAVFLELLSEQVAPSVENAPAPQVESGRGAGTFSCPTTDTQAAEIFGGNEGSWIKERGYNAWVMTHTGLPVTIFVPKEMYAGYMDLTSMEMVSITGPVIVKNVNFIVISCE
ncbi:MAG: hypothetical protein U9Q82_06620 [Chloroflexota bacterium]|nr:hypothetical protein [Chloroflexota bacterium]